jgi:hypothetical protein
MFKLLLLIFFAYLFIITLFKVCVNYFFKLFLISPQYNHQGKDYRRCLQELLYRILLTMSTLILINLKLYVGVDNNLRYTTNIPHLAYYVNTYLQ